MQGLYMFWKVMKIYNAILQDLGNVRQVRLFRMAVEKI